MVFGSNCANKNCVWPYDRAQEDELFAGNSTNPYPELLNLPSMVLFPQTAGDIVKVRSHNLSLIILFIISYHSIIISDISCCTYACYIFLGGTICE